ncbi:hypothetical protein CEXT_344291 [Caerostris extrusa]|uniref:Uncharacterized protein n=1 Tax=Caerostris extrusa TaxID=172846 RepID=A0AAV4TXA6_CAEEX|nr:hypothetical protein CEXT_344291 [Caerostris extrusa]
MRIIAPSGHCSQVTCIYSLNQLPPFDSLIPPQTWRKKIHCNVSGCCAPASVSIGWRSCGISFSDGSENHPFFFRVVILAVFNNLGLDCEELFS